MRDSTTGGEGQGPDVDDEDEWVGPDELARRFNLPLSTIYGWRAKGKGPAGIRVGRHVRYSKAEVARWVAAQRHDQADSRATHDAAAAAEAREAPEAGDEA